MQLTTARRKSPNTTRLDDECAARGHGHPVQWCGRIRVDDTSTHPTTDAWIIECGPLDQHHATRRGRAITLIPNTPGQSSGRGPGTAVDIVRRPCRRTRVGPNHVFERALSWRTIPDGIRSGRQIHVLDHKRHVSSVICRFR